MKTLLLSLLCTSFALALPQSYLGRDMDKPRASKQKSVWDTPAPEDYLLQGDPLSGTVMAKKEIPSAADRLYNALEMNPKTGETQIDGKPLVETKIDILTDPDLNYVPKSVRGETSKFEKIEEEMMKLEQEQLKALRELEEAQLEEDRRKKRRIRRRLRRLRRQRMVGPADPAAQAQIYNHNQ